MASQLHTLSPELASRFVRLVLTGVAREYPSKLDHIIDGEASLLSPRRLHPAFFGCFDWHSCVHGHWLLARILRLVPSLPEAGEVRQALDTSLTDAHIAGEVAYLSRPDAGAFERTYGWAWLLKLAQELRASDSPAAAAWAKALSPLADAFVNRYLAYLPKLSYAIRTGVHPNTAFGLAFAHDYAIAAGHEPLRALVETKAVAFFRGDRDYPGRLEPGGADFFSPTLLEADLMRRIMPPREFREWFDRFLPGIAEGEPGALLTPAAVSDRADLQIVHLDGLNLGRAWCMRNIAAGLPGGHPAVAVLRDSALSHAEASLPHIASGHYAGEHWLATFAMLMLTGDS